MLMTPADPSQVNVFHVRLGIGSVQSRSLPVEKSKFMNTNHV